MISVRTRGIKKNALLLQEKRITSEFKQANLYIVLRKIRNEVDKNMIIYLKGLSINAKAKKLFVREEENLKAWFLLT